MKQENTDLAELAKFSRMAASWWDPDGDCRPLHALNPCRGNFVSTRIDLANAKILDVGCGGGILSEYLARQGAQVTGIDPNEELIDVARLHAQRSHLDIRYEVAEIEDLDITDDRRYDALSCMELVEHVPDPARLVAACAQRVKPNGQIFFSTISRTPKAYALAVIGAEYLLKVLPRGTHDYERFVKPSELARWGRHCGLRLGDTVGMQYNPVTGHARTCADLSVNYLAQFVVQSV